MKIRGKKGIFTKILKNLGCSQMPLVATKPVEKPSLVAKITLQILKNVPVSSSELGVEEFILKM